MAKNGKQINIGREFEGNLIQGDGNTIHNNNIDSKELGQSLGESISERERQARWEEEIREFQGEDSRQVMETAFVSFISGVGIGASWKFAFPWNLMTVPFFVIGITILFNVLRITNFGLRRSIFKVILISVIFLLMLKYTPFAQTWMDVNQFVGTLILATIGAIIGLFVGLIQTFWHPLED